MQLDYNKMSGAGNIFTIIDFRLDKYQISKNQIKEIANQDQTKCDQFIIIKNSHKADIAIEIFNNDGSRVGACGNASRCVAALVMAENNDNTISIETDNDILDCQKKDQYIEVNMGIPRFNWRQIPLKKEIKSKTFRIKHPKIEGWDFIAVNMGNPHIVTFIDNDIADDIFYEIGPFLENHLLFPEKTNIEFANIISPKHIKVRVWERGVGETKACGTGACAVFAAAVRRSIIDGKQKVKISFSGGDIYIESNITGSLNMIGGYKYIANGRITGLSEI